MGAELAKGLGTGTRVWATAEVVGAATCSGADEASTAIWSGVTLLTVG